MSFTCLTGDCFTTYARNDILQNKNLPSTIWDGRENSRGTTQISHPTRRLTHFAPTIISLSYNVEITAQTTKRGMWYLTRSSPERLRRELLPVAAGPESQSMLWRSCRLSLTYFPPSLPL